MKIGVLEKASVTRGDVDTSLLESVAEVTYYDRVEPCDVITECQKYDGIVINKTVIDKNVIDSCPSLKYIGLFATGYNNVDTAYAREKGIAVCNVAGYSTDAVAQHVFTFILQMASSVGRYVSSVADGDWKKCRSFCYYPYPITELKGKTLGIFGLGSIGRRVAEIAKVFGMNVIVHTRTVRDTEFEYVTKEELFKRSDYLSMHCPLNADTSKVVNAEMLALMKPSAVLINTARGGVVDENALASALKDGKLYAACVDTISFEPMREDCPLFGLENCFITPHIAWAARETRQRLVDTAAMNIANFIKGEPTNLVN